VAVIAAAAHDRSHFAPLWDVPGTRRLVTVRIEPAASIADWTPALVDEVMSALKAWEATGVPLDFRIVPPDEPADIRVHWIDRFDGNYEGWTTITWSGAGSLIAANVTLSVHSPKGHRLSPAARDQVLLHELGHAVGLSHSSDTSSIMRANVKALSISDGDAAALRTLYATARASAPASAAVPSARCDDVVTAAGK
jgi:predicted Zn-dependent protease